MEKRNIARKSNRQTKARKAGLAVTIVRVPLGANDPRFVDAFLAHTGGTRWAFEPRTERRTYRWIEP